MLSEMWVKFAMVAELKWNITLKCGDNSSTYYIVAQWPQTHNLGTLQSADADKSRIVSIFLLPDIDEYEILQAIFRRLKQEPV